MIFYVIFTFLGRKHSGILSEVFIEVPHVLNLKLTSLEVGLLLGTFGGFLKAFCCPFYFTDFYHYTYYCAFTAKSRQNRRAYLTPVKSPQMLLKQLQNYPDPDSAWRVQLFIGTMCTYREAGRGSTSSRRDNYHRPALLIMHEDKTILKTVCARKCSVQLCFGLVSGL